MYVIYCSITDLYVEDWSFAYHSPAWWTSSTEGAMKVSCRELASEVISLIDTPGLKAIPV